MGGQGISRRQLLGALPLGMGLLVPAWARGSVADGYDVARVTEAVTNVLGEQGRFFGDQLTETEKANIRSACAVIRPTTHVEMAFTVACGGQKQDATDLIQEFALRRGGAPARFIPDPPEVTPWAECHLETHRILLFKEQLFRYWDEMTEFTSKPPHFMVVLMEGWGPKEMRAALGPPSVNGTDEEVSSILDVFRSLGPRVRPYMVCSSMAAQVERLLA